MNIYITLLLLMISTNLMAGEFTLDNKDYETAKKAEQFFKFIGKSTKFGMVTTSFDGYVKNASVYYDLKDNLIGSASVSFEVKSIDTDSSGRNEKLYDHSMEANKYPKITVIINAPIDLTKENQTIPATMKIKDTDLALKLDLNISQNDQTLIHGKTSFNFKDAHIIDPSIAIASVKEIFDIEFKIRIKK